MDELRDDTDYVYIRNESMPTFKEMWNRDDLSDVQLCCDSKKFNVHRFLLAACSPYFQSLFQRNSCENLNVEIDNVKCVDLQHVLTYMYEGSVRVKNDDLQGFGELLEMFLMPLPVDMVVSTENSETDVESIEKIDEYGVDNFIANVQEVVSKLTIDNFLVQSMTLLALANGSGCRHEAIVNILLQNVVKITEKCNSRLLSLLAKMTCCHDQTKQFQEHVRNKSIHVLRYLLNAALQQRKPLQLTPIDNAINTLDREAIRIEYIGYHWNVVRRRRFTHFIAELCAASIVTYTDVFDLKQSYPELAFDLILKNSFDQTDCCDFDMSSVTKDIIHNESYRFAREIDNHLFCLRTQNNQIEVREFSGLINGPRPNRSRKRKRGKRSSVERANKAITSNKSTRTN